MLENPSFSHKYCFAVKEAHAGMENIFLIKLQNAHLVVWGGSLLFEMVIH